MLLASGETLQQVDLAYQTWGTLNEDRSNAVLIFHALSGNHHLAGVNTTNPEADPLWQPELHLGWWDAMVGPGKAIDTDKLFVICFNFLGGCYGSTGPRSENPATGLPYGATFPAVSIADQAACGAGLLDQLDIATLRAVIGPSVGGLCALTFATNHPERTRDVICIASGYKTTVLNRLCLFEQILAIENDSAFNGGNYYDSSGPVYGLALARMISHKTFVHLDTIERRAGGEVVQHADTLAWYTVQDNVQSYMLHQGKKFTSRFDANTYLRIIDMWSRYSAENEARAKNSGELFAGSREHGHRYLVFSIDSDFCFYPEEQAELIRHLEDAGVENMHITVHSQKGHDSFLLEPGLYAPHISFLLS